MQFQQNVNRNMVEHLNMTTKNQLLQGQALERLVENTRQREFDKLFDSIPVYDGEDPEKFEPWLSKLESACLVGKRDVREVAICSSTGPVLEVLKSIEDKEDWATHRDELRCVISYPTFQTPPNILKEGEGGVMGMNRGEKGEKSLVELEGERG